MKTKILKILLWSAIIMGQACFPDSAAAQEAESQIAALEELAEIDIPCLAPVESDEKGWGKAAYFWRKDVVTFNFMPTEGNDQLKERVTNEALKWNGLARITLKRIPDNETSDVRVGFGTYGHWSKVGRTSLQVPENDRTMNLQISNGSGNEEVRRVTLHEFGHALGLMHEHQSPHVTIQWKEDAVFQYYSGAPNYWNETQIRTNVLSHYRETNTVSTAFDEKSIMLYPISRSLTHNFSSGRNTKLSDKDREFLKAAYPAN